MKIWKVILPAAAILLFAGQAIAQSDAEQIARVTEIREVEMAERLREAEERMEVAAREIAEITRERLPQIAQIVRRFEFSNKPRIGITIDGVDKNEPVAGVEVSGVTPESAADDAGLRAGDIITAVNDEPMSASSSHDANDLLLDFMQGVEEGDELKIDYLRNGKAGSVELSPRVVEMHVFSWMPGAEHSHIPDVPDLAFAPQSIERFRLHLGFPLAGSAWGNMELVELNAGLGKYFGTDSGLLVVSAPDADGLDLQDGDVIKSIDGREPKSVRHAMRILSSYQSGEKLKLGILRDKKKRTIEVEIPADYRGLLFAPPAAKPARVPTPPRAATETVST